MTEIRYVPLPDTTPETKLVALAVVYKFILDCQAKTKAAEIRSGEDDAKHAKNEGRPA
jgi:hypothetical protein